MEIFNWLEKLVRYIVTNDLISPRVSFVGIIVSTLVLRATIKALNEQNRPFISLSIEPIRRMGNLYIVIRNTGNRTAENLIIKTTPKLVSYAYRDRKGDGLAIINEQGEIKLSGTSPNQIITTFFDLGLYRYNKNNDKDLVQDQVKLELSYNYKKRKFREESFSDFSYIEYTTDISSSSDIEPNIKRIADNLEKIDRQIRCINENNQALKN